MTSINAELTSQCCLITQAGQGRSYHVFCLGVMLKIWEKTFLHPKHACAMLFLLKVALHLQLLRYCAMVLIQGHHSWLARVYCFLGGCVAFILVFFANHYRRNIILRWCLCFSLQLLATSTYISTTSQKAYNTCPTPLWKQNKTKQKENFWVDLYS